MSEIIKDESNNNEILPFFNKNNDYLKKLEDIKTKVLKNKKIFDEKLKINKNINKKVNIVNEQIKNDEVLDNLNKKRCCENKKNKVLKDKNCCKNKKNKVLKDKNCCKKQKNKK